MQRAGRRSTERQGARVPDSSRPRVKDKPSCPPAAGAGAPAPPTTRPAARTRMRTTRGLTRRAWVRERRAPPEEEACVDGPPARRRGGGKASGASSPLLVSRGPASQAVALPPTSTSARRGHSPQRSGCCGVSRGFATPSHPEPERRPAARPCPQPAWRSWFCRSRYPQPPTPRTQTESRREGPRVAPAERRGPRSAPERLALRGSRGALRGAGRTGAEVPFFCSGSFRIKGRQLGL